MLLIEQKEATKLIRQNKDIHEDCQAIIFYNKGCEHSAQIVEQMKVREIIYCKDCMWSDWYKASDGRHYCYCVETGLWSRTETDFCSRAKPLPFDEMKKGKVDGNN